ncbi:hypothetical protein RF11_09724 [Thelohanellus kitauei]|uniref:Uncharacterized protein n=1 Tax=Thelohanellus kitauei TaxID=669202 RepID=A0A0C2N822_THEKT|nr:hypothetical protein RF11_09724 [Thelohanellus kitauei]
MEGICEEQAISKWKEYVKSHRPEIESELLNFMTEGVAIKTREDGNRYYRHGLPFTTVSEWAKFIRSLLGDYLDLTNTMIGGDALGVVVAGNERTTENILFAVEVENRDTHTASNINPSSHPRLENIHRNVEKSTIQSPLKIRYKVSTLKTIEWLNNGLKYRPQARNKVKKNVHNHLLYFV